MAWHGSLKRSLHAAPYFISGLTQGVYQHINLHGMIRMPGHHPSATHTSSLLLNMLLNLCLSALAK